MDAPYCSNFRVVFPGFHCRFSEFGAIWWCMLLDELILFISVRVVECPLEIYVWWQALAEEPPLSAPLALCTPWSLTTCQHQTVVSLVFRVLLWPFWNILTTLPLSSYCQRRTMASIAFPWVSMAVQPPTSDGNLCSSEAWLSDWVCLTSTWDPIQIILIYSIVYSLGSLLGFP